jgi:hypothetical protein
MVKMGWIRFGLRKFLDQRRPKEGGGGGGGGKSYI